MVSKELREKALKIANKVHKNQTRRNGSPYMDHVMAVANNFDENTEEYVVAILHDTIEDGNGWPTEEILLKDFPKKIVDAVVALTRFDNNHYYEYIIGVEREGGLLAVRVKIADIKHNLSTIEPTKFAKIDKYMMALHILESHL